MNGATVTPGMVFMTATIRLPSGDVWQESDQTIYGSYAELVTIPASKVVEVSTSLPWADLVASPEVYATAWAGLRQNLDLRPGQTVLIRGATSALGQAAVNVAANLGPP
jgi:NADPH2:quinone reductase